MGNLVLKTDAYNEGVEKGIFDIDKFHFHLFVIIDLSNYIIKRCRLNHRDLLIVNSDIRCLPFRENVFDGIMDLSTSDHIKFSQLSGTYKGYYKSLRKDGWILIIFNKKNLLGSLIKLFRKCFKGIKYGKYEPTYFFSVRATKRIFEKFFIILGHGNRGAELISTVKKPRILKDYLGYMSYYFYGMKRLEHKGSNKKT